MQQREHLASSGEGGRVTSIQAIGPNCIFPTLHVGAAERCVWRKNKWMAPRSDATEENWKLFNLFWVYSRQISYYLFWWQMFVGRKQKNAPFNTEGKSVLNTHCTIMIPKRSLLHLEAGNIFSDLFASTFVYQTVSSTDNKRWQENYCDDKTFTFIQISPLVPLGQPKTGPGRPNHSRAPKWFTKPKHYFVILQKYLYPISNIFNKFKWTPEWLISSSKWKGLLTKYFSPTWTNLF